MPWVKKKKKKNHTNIKQKQYCNKLNKDLKKKKKKESNPYKIRDCLFFFPEMSS